MEFLKALLISAVMLINPLLLPPNLRTIQPKNQQLSIEDITVQCQIPSLCGGGTKTLQKWQCDAAVCCETNGKWEFHFDGRKCETPKPIQSAVQPTQKQQAVVPTSNKGSCVGPDNKVMSLTQKECEDFNKAWGKANNWTPAGGVVTIDCLLFDGHHILSDPQTCEDFNNRKFDPDANKQNNNAQSQTPQYQAPQTFTCTVSYPCTGSVKTYQLTTENCISFQNLARDTCNPATIPPMPTYEQYNPTPTVTQSDVDVYNNKVSQCQNDVARKYSDLIQSCSARFGSSSAAEACRQINSGERDQQYKNCGSKI